MGHIKRFLKYDIRRHSAKLKKIHRKVDLLIIDVTRMHSSRMRTVHSSSCLLGEGEGGVSLSACWDTSPQVWVWRHPPWVWNWRPHQPDPSTSPLSVDLENPPPPIRPLNFPHGCGPGEPPAQPDPSTFLLGVWAWRPARHAGIPPPPPWTHAPENITLPQLRCGR